MMPLPHAPDLLKVAKRVVWFEPPEKALDDPMRFLAYLMNDGTLDEVLTVRRFASADAFREALEHAPAGIFRPAKWSYWNLAYGRKPVPPMPKRAGTIGDVPGWR